MLVENNIQNEYAAADINKQTNICTDRDTELLIKKPTMTIISYDGYTTFSKTAPMNGTIES
jgi:hypothetical protein